MRESEHRSNEMVVGLMEEQCTSVQSTGEFPSYPATESMDAESNAQSQLHIHILKWRTVLKRGDASYPYADNHIYMASPQLLRRDFHQSKL
ncbi:hypothetical protein SUGI_0626370 [Cryptomeria japonica]|nr:hypothetical protein SUGI_0626370 [Cryptomeria japonica]